MRISKDVIIRTRDNTSLVADVFLPEAEGRYPALVTLSPYQKDIPWHVPDGHTAAQHQYQCWETPDPIRWTEAGYAVVRVDARGSGKSGGVHSVMSRQEAEDFYDAIEAIARADWCTGKVGTTGVSYYAMTQWQVAALAPPSLKAIVPWSGCSDIYRDFVYRGGVMNFMFFDQWYSRLVLDHMQTGIRDSAATYGSEDAVRLFGLNACDGPFWDQRRPDPAAVTVPFLSASSWGSWKGPGHIRGNLEMFKLAPSRHKRLRIAHSNYFTDYYSDVSFAEQKRWFDHWLKGVGELGDEPAVRLEVSSVGAGAQSSWRSATDWPLPLTKVKSLSLAQDETGKGTLIDATAPSTGHALSYEAPGELPLDAEPILGHVDEMRFGVSFESAPFQTDLSLIGEVALVVWGSSSFNDLELHAFLSVIDTDGSVHEVSRGWLKASLRGLDPARSTALQPFHTHDHYRPLTPGQPERLDVEIWPIATKMRAGQRLHLRLAGRGPGTLSGWHRRPRGSHTIHFGGDTPSCLMLPVAPEE